MSSQTALAEPAWFHLLRDKEPAVFLTGGSMLFDIEQDFFEALARAEPAALTELRGLATPPPEEPDALAPIAALSLNIAQSCNLACTYCYADEGRFGGRSRMMERPVAFAAIDRLLAQARGRATIGFIGGEPFLNRPLLHGAVAYAKQVAAIESVDVGFSVTTNATLLRDDDIALLRDEAFTVTVSLDGAPPQNVHRKDRRGRDSTTATLAAIDPLLARPGRARLSARATLTRGDLDVAGRLEWLSAAGFGQIGVSPTRTGPKPELQLGENDWAELLERIIEAANVELDRIFVGLPPRFSNLWAALGAIHSGAARTLPCGSAATYLSVDVDGAFASCHRTVGQQAFRMGSVGEGFDADSRRQFVTARSVDRQEPCRVCWARYLCGGGCHAEVTAAGRAGCDYIRGWLDYCLRAYRTVSDRRPELLTGGAT
jgi:uncharacterized protein